MSMSMGEGTTLNILSRDTDIVTILDQGSTGKCFGSSPIYSFFILVGLNSGIKDLLDLSMELSILR